MQHNCLNLPPKITPHIELTSTTKKWGEALKQGPRKDGYHRLQANANAANSFNRAPATWSLCRYTSTAARSPVPENAAKISDCGTDIKSSSHTNDDPQTKKLPSPSPHEKICQRTSRLLRDDAYELLVPREGRQILPP